MLVAPAWPWFHHFWKFRSTHGPVVGAGAYGLSAPPNRHAFVPAGGRGREREAPDRPVRLHTDRLAVPEPAGSDLVEGHVPDRGDGLRELVRDEAGAAGARPPGQGPGGGGRARAARGPARGGGGGLGQGVADVVGRIAPHDPPRAAARVPAG